MDDDDASDLVARARRGDENAFRVIFDRHHRFIIRFIYGMVGDRGLAEELTQETFIRGYRSFGSLRDEEKLANWLCGIAKNVVRKSFRARRREQGKVDVEAPAVAGLSDPDTPSPADLVLNNELRSVIQSALSKLDDDKRMVFTLKVLQQCSYKEIAEITGYAIPKLKTDVHRAKAEMRRLIRPYLEDDNEM